MATKRYYKVAFMVDKTIINTVNLGESAGNAACKMVVDYYYRYKKEYPDSLVEYETYWDNEEF